MNWSEHFALKYFGQSFSIKETRLPKSFLGPEWKYGCTWRHRLRPAESSGMMANGETSHWCRVILVNFPVILEVAEKLHRTKWKNKQAWGTWNGRGDATESSGRRQKKGLKSSSCWGTELAGTNNPGQSWVPPVSCLGSALPIWNLGERPALSHLEQQDNTTLIPKPCGAHWKISPRHWGV